MTLYTVAALGTGTAADPYRPDLPAGASFAGARDVSTSTYLVSVPDAAVLPVKAGTTSLSTATAVSNACTARGLSPTAVSSWKVA